MPDLEIRIDLTKVEEDLRKYKCLHHELQGRAPRDITARYEGAIEILERIKGGLYNED